MLNATDNTCHTRAQAPTGTQKHLIGGPPMLTNSIIGMIRRRWPKFQPALELGLLLGVEKARAISISIICAKN